MEHEQVTVSRTDGDRLDGRGRPPRAAEPAVVVYTLPGCVHCERARGILRRRGIAFEERSGAGVAGFRAWLAANAAGATVPQVVIHGVPTGGADQLAALDRSGALVPLVAGEAFPRAVVRRDGTLGGLIRRLVGREPRRFTVDTVDGAGRLLARVAAPSEAAAEDACASLNADRDGHD